MTVHTDMIIYLKEKVRIFIAYWCYHHKLSIYDIILIGLIEILKSFSHVYLSTLWIYRTFLFKIQVKKPKFNDNFKNEWVWCISYTFCYFLRPIFIFFEMNISLLKKKNFFLKRIWSIWYLDDLVMIGRVIFHCSQDNADD